MIIVLISKRHVVAESILTRLSSYLFGYGVKGNLKFTTGLQNRMNISVKEV